MGTSLFQPILIPSLLLCFFAPLYVTATASREIRLSTSTNVGGGESYRVSSEEEDGDESSTWVLGEIRVLLGFKTHGRSGNRRTGSAPAPAPTPMVNGKHTPDPLPFFAHGNPNIPLVQPSFILPHEMDSQGGNAAGDGSYVRRFVTVIVVSVGTFVVLIMVVFGFLRMVWRKKQKGKGEVGFLGFCGCRRFWMLPEEAAATKLDLEEGKVVVFDEGPEHFYLNTLNPGRTVATQSQNLGLLLGKSSENTSPRNVHYETNCEMSSPFESVEIIPVDHSSEEDDESFHSLGDSILSRISNVSEIGNASPLSTTSSCLDFSSKNNQIEDADELSPWNSESSMSNRSSQRITSNLSYCQRIIVSNSPMSSRDLPPQPPPPPPPPSTSFLPSLRPRNSIHTVTRISNSISSKLLSPAPPPPPPPPPMFPSTSFSSPTLVSHPQTSPIAERRLNSEELTAVTGRERCDLPKLKPLHWDKVWAAPDQSMVWHKLRSGSFELDEEMIESLFGYNSQNTVRSDESKFKNSPPGNHVLDQKRSQNISILFKALNASPDQVCLALTQGNGLTVEQLEALKKMAPTEEEQMLLNNIEDAASELGPAEKFVKEILCVPLAFLRVDAMLFRETFEDEVSYLRNTFNVLEDACKELRSSYLFEKLLEAVLKTGNRMNAGTNRGSARAFKLDTLLKLADVKGTDGKMTLLHFVVQEITRTQKCRGLESSKEKECQERDDCRRSTSFDLVSDLSSELNNVRRAAGFDLNSLVKSLVKLSDGMTRVLELIQEASTSLGDHGDFVMLLTSFVEHAKTEIKRLQGDQERVLILVRNTSEYFHGEQSNKESNPLSLFVTVSNFLGLLDNVSKEIKSLKQSNAR